MKRREIKREVKSMANEFLTSEERYLFGEGTFYDCPRKFGAHFSRQGSTEGFAFTVWAPHATNVWVTGSFNQWRMQEFPLAPLEDSGVWSGFVARAEPGDLYKYVIQTGEGDILLKADPFAFMSECPPGTASKLTRFPDYAWQDHLWMRKRKRKNFFSQPLNIYEVHATSWRRHPKSDLSNQSFYSWTELAQELIPYVKKMHYTHLELLPIMEHPFDGSWGYQITGYFAPTARLGKPQDFMAFIDRCHQEGIGVILDWVPGHFCRDAHGLGNFDGKPLYECGDHEQWGTYLFDFARNEVRSFLISNALFWLETYHIDGLRVDGVSSMLNLNFGVIREEKKRYNSKGGEENLDAVAFLRQLNQTVGKRCPGVWMIAEESTAWPLVTYPPEDGGLGFHYKWDMGWMNDTLRYMQTDFSERPREHEKLTFSMMYQFHENFILPLSHDEVVHGKHSLIGRMPGTYSQQFAGLRLLYLYQMTHPGGKLNFMGNEIGQFIEWRYDESIEWFLLDYESHFRYQNYVQTVNRLYLREKAFWLQDHDWKGFVWIEANNRKQSVFVYIRRTGKPKEQCLVLLNFQPIAYTDYRIGVPEKGRYRESFNTDAIEFGGSGQTNPHVRKTEEISWQGLSQSLTLTVPPLGGIILKRYGKSQKEK